MLNEILRKPYTAFLDASVFANELPDSSPKLEAYFTAPQ